MKRNLLFILGICFFLISTSFVFAENDVNFILREPSTNNATMHGDAKEQIFKVTFDKEMDCTYESKACKNGDCKQLDLETGVTFEESETFYFTGFYRKFTGLTKGYEYSIILNCMDKEGNTAASEEYLFRVADDANVDTNTPSISFDYSDKNSIYYNNYVGLIAKVDKLSKCSHEIKFCSESGDCENLGGDSSDDIYLDTYKRKIENLDKIGGEYTFAVTCEDLSGISNTESFSINRPTPVSVNYPNSSSSSGGGGGGVGSSCSQYYKCDDGTLVDYCERVREEIPSTCSGSPPICTSGSVSIKCVCEDDPEELCESPSSEEGSGGGGGGVEPVPIPSDGGGGGGTSNQTPSCNGCDLEDKCVPIGYRTNNTYCDINSKFVNQSNADALCNNNFECESNLCVDSQCVSSGLIQKIISWFKKIFG